MSAILQAPFSTVFLEIQIYLKFSTIGTNDNKSALVQVMAW